MRKSREEEAANRLERIKWAIEKGITANVEKGEVFDNKGKLVTSKHYGYIRINFRYDGKMINILAHQFIYYLAHGIVDYGEGFSLDHNNRIKDDNRISNLSIESDSRQQRNQDSYDEAKGYYLCKRTQKWRAQIMVDGERIPLGRFIHKADADKAYQDAKIKYHQIKNP